MILTEVIKKDKEAACLEEEIKESVAREQLHDEVELRG